MPDGPIYGERPGEVIPGSGAGGTDAEAPTYYDSGGWTAQTRAGEFWLLCVRCQRPVKHGDTQREVETDRRVCDRCVDEPGRDTMREIARARLERARTEEQRRAEP